MHKKQLADIEIEVQRYIQQLQDDFHDKFQ
jgi:hypothetical protein